MGRNTKDGDEVIVTPVEKNVVFEDSEELLNQVDIQIEKITNQIDRNRQTSNIRNRSQG